MNRDEAKYLLSSCHIRGEDADDPAFSEAFAALKHDPLLADWFAQEQAIDSALSASLHDFPVPPELKVQLMAARRVPQRPAWWQRAAWRYAAAACIAAAALVTVLALRHPNPATPAATAEIPQPLAFADFCSRSATAARAVAYLDVESTDFAQVRQYLQQQQSPGDWPVPPALDGHAVGCRVFHWQGNSVSLVCFELNDGAVVHLFVADRSAIRDALPGSAPRYSTDKAGVSIAAWNDDRRVYVLACSEGEKPLHRLLSMVNPPAQLKKLA